MNSSAKISNKEMQQTNSTYPDPYSADENFHRLKALSDMLPNLSVVRTDRTKPGPHDNGNPVRASLEFSNHNLIKISLAHHVSERETETIARQLGINQDEMQTVIGVLKQIARNNALGVWCLFPSEVESIELSETHVGERDLAPNDYLSDTCQQLASDLYGVGEIQIDCIVIQQGQGKYAKKSRRSFLRFIAPDGECEVAAMEATAFALHARHQLLQPQDDPMLELNLARVDHWANQLDVSPDVLAELFGTLIFLTSALHITRIQLR